MKTIELSLASTYTDWTPREGLREFIQNALDADAEFPMKIDQSAESGERCITITSAGATLSLKHLLLGTSIKSGNNARGKFGEGFKLGALAILRSGGTCRIFTGSEHWWFRISPSKQFEGVDCLQVDITQQHLRQRCAGLRVELTGDFPQLSEIYCGDGPPDAKSTLIGSSWKRGNGKIYVGGIYVSAIAGPLSFNFEPSVAHTDRDRSWLFNRHALAAVHLSHIVNTPQEWADFEDVGIDWNDLTPGRPVDLTEAWERCFPGRVPVSASGSAPNGTLCYGPMRKFIRTLHEKADSRPPTLTELAVLSALKDLIPSLPIQHIRILDGDGPRAAYDPNTDTILIRTEDLNNTSTACAVLLHELAHMLSFQRQRSTDHDTCFATTLTELTEETLTELVEKNRRDNE